MIVNMNQLRVFHTVASQGSMTQAAQALNVTTQAISKQLKILEDILELKLYYIEGRSVKLTFIGSEIYKMTKEVFDKVNKLEKYIQDLSKVKSDYLRVGYSQRSLKHVLPEIFDGFKKNHPDIKIKLEQGSAFDIIEGVLDGQIDIAMVGQLPDVYKNRLKYKKFKSRPLHLIASPSYSIPPELDVAELSKFPLFLPPEGSATRIAILEFLKKFGISPNIVFESSSIDIQKEMVKQGKGLMFLPNISFKAYSKSSEIKTVYIREGYPETSRIIIYLDKDFQLPTIRSFLKIMEKLDSQDK